MKICPRCRAQFEDDMNFCLQDGTPLIEEKQFSNPTESFSEQTLNLPTAPKPPAPTQSFFEPLNPPTTAQSNQPTVVLNDQPTVAPKIETLPVFASLATGSPDSKSRGNLMVASLAGILVLIGTALSGVWWYSQSGKNREVALANTNNQNPPTVVNQNSDPGFSNKSNSATFSNQTETSGRSNSNSIIKLSTPTPAETPKPTPPKEPTPNAVNARENEPPPDKTPPPKSVPKTISGGVLNGKAINLVKPAYPAAARAVRASGAVQVQVTIDENGNVISASAVSGHPLLRSSAEQAARSSKFSPTMISGQAVKVTGVIVYNFVP